MSVTQFYSIRSINPSCGLRLKQPVLITVNPTNAGDWIASGRPLSTAIVTGQPQIILDLFLATMVSRYYALRLRMHDLAPDLYDEWRALDQFLG